MSGLSPMMQQYKEIKSQYKDCILFFRLGDFYEMFFEDAELASKELEIALTGRDCGLPERAPMCGVPYHSADSYIAKLINKGYKVAICEQMEDPALAKGIVKREVIRIVTPGTITDETALDDRKNNYLMAIYREGYSFGIAVADLSTGDFYCTEISFGNTIGKLTGEVAKYAPSEIIANTRLIKDESLMKSITGRNSVFITPCEDELFDKGKAMLNIKSRFGEDDARRVKNLAINAAGALLEYLSRTQKVSLDHMRTLNPYSIEGYMMLDAIARTNLELTETMRGKSRKGSLLWVLDRTVTPMGGRLIRRWVEQPLIGVEDIRERLDAVEEVKNQFVARMELREQLKKVYDMERLVGKVILGNANCRDLIALKNSIARLPGVKKALSSLNSALNRKIFDELDTLDDVFMLIESSIVDDPPVSVREGGIIKSGYNAEVDRLRKASTAGKEWIVRFESEERERTGIKNLKVGYNKVFGYYIEVTRSYYSMVPEDYIRKQTLANCERYITGSLKEIEDEILGAEEKVVELEYRLFTQVKDQIASQVGRIKKAAACVAMTDVICSLAEAADKEGYCRPEVNEGGKIEILDGRHPVVEKSIEGGSFVPNDAFLDWDENRVLIITGPNMAGKSTYIRQVALIVLMAQVGSFVPAREARIGIVDRIFTRVGASDDLASGQSTFMVEMSEVANIIRNATKRSLLILDEVGRGTSTFDGLSIAWSVVEYISDPEKLGARTLFATHYHELTQLEGKLSGIRNYCMLAEERGEDIVFMRKVVRGGADDSYGIHVAKLAGIPYQVLERAREILEELENLSISKRGVRPKKQKAHIDGQLDLFAFSREAKVNRELVHEIKNLDIQNMTPIEALNTLYRLQHKAMDT